MFVDYLTVMMVAVVAGAVVTIVYGLMFLDAPLADQRPWGWAFGIVGLLLGVTGLHLVLTWPLPGAYNIVMGEPALYFGLVLLGTAFAIRAGESLAACGARHLRGPSEHLLEHRHVGPRPLTQPSALVPCLRSYRIRCCACAPGRTQGEDIALGAFGGRGTIGHRSSDLRFGRLRRISGAHLRGGGLRQVGASSHEAGAIVGDRPGLRSPVEHTRTTPTSSTRESTGGRWVTSPDSRERRRNH